MLTSKFFAIAEFGHEATLFILIALSIFSISFIIERWLYLRSYRSHAKKVATRIREILHTNDYQLIERMALETESFEGRALNQALKYIKNNGTQGVEEVFSSFALTERPKLEKFLNFLATVGSNAPFIGLLGTVFGIMDAFRELATSHGEATAVMSGISEALVATAVGLMVAIPAVVAYNTYQRQVKSVMQSLESVKEVCLAYVKAKKG